ncbi:MAG TPA: hypothetical protein VF911_14635 [Thermoanaerobaculia bacterium]
MKRAAFVALTMLLTLTAVAQPHPTIERGFHAEKVYQFGNVDSVNVFNGNVLVTPRAWPSFPVSSTLTYRVPLVYNAKIWDYVMIYDDLHPGQSWVKAQLDHKSNAGIGWRVSFGRLKGYDGAAAGSNELSEYEGPDGAIHKLHKTKHPADGATLEEPFTWYTRDGSQIRVRKVNGRMLVEFPTGEVHEYEYVSASNWRIKRMRDQATVNGEPVNFVDVFYETSSTVCAYPLTEVWRLADSHGRRQDVCFRNQMHDGEVRPTVSEVVVRGVNNAVERYTFGHTSMTVPRERRAKNSWSEDSNTVTAPTLTSITLPDGSTYAMKYASDGAGQVAPGRINELTLPTGGRTTWEYVIWQMAHTEACLTYARDPLDFYTFTPGVKTKTAYPAGETTGGATWNYTPHMEPNGGPYYECTDEAGNLLGYGEKPGEQFTVTLKAPDNNETVHYFSVWPGYNNQVLASDGGFRPSEYGLPFTRRFTTGDGLFLSSDAFDCSSGSCVSQRKTYVAYEADGTTLHRVDDHHRMNRQRTVFVTDDGKYVDTRFEDYDGYGNFRQQTTTGIFGSDVAKTMFTNFNPTSDAEGRTTSGTRAIAAGTPWVLQKFSETRSELGTLVKARSLACFDADGSLRGVRTLADPSSSAASATDVVTLFQYDAGNLVREDWFGGDTQDAQFVSDLCAAAEGSTYRKSYGYAFGSLSSVNVHGKDGDRPSILRLESYTINAATGLVVTSKDPSDVVTTYGYGVMGRLTSVTTPGSATTSYVYARRNPDAGVTFATVTVTTDAADAGNDATATIEYDGFGRIKSETRQLPGVTASRDTTYDSMGRRASVSEWESGTPSKFTTFTYDAFGRVASVTTPDGSETRTTYTGGGIRELTRSTPLGTKYVNGVVVPSEALVKETYDLHGRLTYIAEGLLPIAGGTPSDPISETAYTYDVKDRLTKVVMTGKDRTGANASQTRTFNYDSRGFLTSEAHPESGTTTYKEYDARGHARLQWNGNSRGIFDLRFEYDDAERLRKVFSREPGLAAETFRIAKEFVYDSTNSKGLSQEKLITSIRHNYTPFGDTVVTDSFSYGGASSGANAGRLISKKTQIQNTTTGTNQTLEQAYSYNDLGLPVTHNYPTCLSGVLCGQGATTAISRSYSKGYLQSIAGYVSGVTYHPNGLYHQITHVGTQQVVDTQTIATNAMARPASITFAQATSCTSPAPIAPPDRAIQPNTTTTLTASSGGTGPFAYKWYRGFAPDRSIPVGTNALFTTPALSQTTYYWFEATNSCGTDVSSTVTVSICSAPSLSGPSAVTLTAGDAATLTVDPGAGTFTYQWFLGTIVVGTSQTYATGALFEDTVYMVRVTNSCGATADRYVTVTVTCPAPVLNAPDSVTVAPGSGTLLIANLSDQSLSPFTFEWFIGTTRVGTAATLSTGALNATTTYRVVVTNRCGATGFRDVTVTVAMPPSTLVATSVGANRIDLAWTAAQSVSHYEVQRKSGAAGYALVATPAGTSWPDVGAPSNAACAYRVRAVHTDGTRSSFSNVDIGTTVTFVEAITPGVTIIDATHVLELRSAAAALRVTANLAAYAWSDVPLQVGMPVRAIHLTQLRSAINEARAQLTLPVLTFAKPTITAGVSFVGASDWIELRQGCR